MRSFVDQKDSEIVKRIGEEAGLTVHATNSKVVHPHLLQAGRTDLDFLIERARRIQFELVMLNGELFFRPVANAGEEVLTLSFKDDLLEFEPRLSLTPATQLQILGLGCQGQAAHRCRGRTAQGPGRELHGRSG